LKGLPQRRQPKNKENLSSDVPIPEKPNKPLHCNGLAICKPPPYGAFFAVCKAFTDAPENLLATFVRKGEQYV
jgi:hypothetical protein